jgi:hypothetical protein
VHEFAVNRLGDDYLKYLPDPRPDKFVCKQKPGYGGLSVCGDYEKMTSLKFNRKLVLYNRDKDIVIFWGGERW